MFDLSSLGDWFQRPFNNLSNAFDNAGNMLTSPFNSGQQQPGMPMDITAQGAAAQQTPPQVQAPHQQSDLSKRFQALGSMGAGQQSPFSPVQFSAPQGGGLAQAIAQIMQQRGMR